MTARLRWWTRRRAAVVGTVVAAISGAAISYDALAAIARDAGVPAFLSWLFPLGVDGLIAVATVAALEVRARRARVEVWTLLGAAIAVSVAGNAAHAGAGGARVYGPVTVHALWSAVPACAYAAALHLLVLIYRAGAPAAGRASREARVPATSAQRRRSARVALPDGRQVSQGHARKLRARQRAMEAADAA